MRHLLSKILIAALGFLPLLSARAATWTLLNGDRLTGELMREDKDAIEIEHAQLGRLKVPRAALQIAAPQPVLVTSADAVRPGTNTAVKPKAPNWKRQVEFGYAQQSGAKEKQDLSMRVQLDGRNGLNTYRATARVIQTEADGLTVADRQEADFRWRYDVNKRLFAQALTTYAEDGLRQIDLSLEQQLGGGFRVVDSAKHKANVGVGAVVQYLDRESVEPQTALLGSVFQDYAYELNNRVKLTQESNFMISDTGTLNLRTGLVNAPVSNNYRLKFNTGVQSKVTDRMSLNVRFEYDYDRSILETDLRADQRLTTSLGYIW